MRCFCIIFTFTCGIDLALNLNYNSRLWNKSGSQLTYDIDRGFPGPGWSLGFGKVAFMGGKGTKLMSVADGASLPVAVHTESATPHEVRLVEKTIVERFTDERPEKMIGDKAYDSDPFGRAVDETRH